jgi:hypothetical protein
VDARRRTKVWKALAAELEAATDRVAVALEGDDSELEAAVRGYRITAGRIMACPTDSTSVLRTKLSLAAWLAGARCPTWLEPDNNPSRLEAIFCVLDAALSQYHRGEPARLQKAARRLATRKGSGPL